MLLWKVIVIDVMDSVFREVRTEVSYVIQISGIQPGVCVPPGVSEDVLGVRELKKYI